MDNLEHPVPFLGTLRVQKRSRGAPSWFHLTPKKQSIQNSTILRLPTLSPSWVVPYCTSPHLTVASASLRVREIRCRLGVVFLPWCALRPFAAVSSHAASCSHSAPLARRLNNGRVSFSSFGNSVSGSKVRGEGNCVAEVGDR